MEQRKGKKKHHRVEHCRLSMAKRCIITSVRVPASIESASSIKTAIAEAIRVVKGDQ